MVHNHPPNEPPCVERRATNGWLLGACLASPVKAEPGWVSSRLCDLQVPAKGVE